MTAVLSGISGVLGALTTRWPSRWPPVIRWGLEAGMTLPSPVLDAVIDVSHHNGAINWRAVAADGIVLAFIKATQGPDFVDPTFAANRAAATAAGVLVVPYHFVDASDEAAQAAHFTQVGRVVPRAPAMLDWETACGVGVIVAIGGTIASATGQAIQSGITGGAARGAGSGSWRAGR